MIRTVHTSQASYDALFQFGEDLGKECVSCGDTPGFIVNRLLIPYMMDAIRMVERGEVSVHLMMNCLPVRLLTQGPQESVGLIYARKRR